MIMLDDTTALVYNTNDLRDAVSSDNGVDRVFFGADITLGYGISIAPGKLSLTFDGTYEGVTYTFTDMNSISELDTIGIRTASNITITFQNINLIGRNYYGIPFVPNNPACNGASTIYHKVTYRGTQLTHNPYGFTRFIDCDIMVDHDEAAETSRLEIGGVTTIVKTNELHSVFWFRGSSSLKPYMRVLAGADVSITTALYFMYENYPPDLILEPGASLSIGTNTGFGYASGHTVSSFLVDENASFRYTQDAYRSCSTIYLDGALTVNEGASFYMQANFENTHRLIHFTGSSGGLYVNNPKSFVLYNQGSATAKAFYFASAIPFTLSGGQVNYWENATPFPTAGTLEDSPLHKWNRPGYGRFTLQGTASNSQTSIAFNDFTPEELVDLPPLGDLLLQKAQVFSIGHMLLSIYSTVISRCIMGETEAHANVRATFIPSHYRDPQTVVSDEQGLFELTPTTPVPFSDHVEVFSNTPFLIVSSVEAVREEGELSIAYAPQKVHFPFRPMSGFSDVILPRDNPDDTVEVLDTRAPKTVWQLWVRISGPLRTDEGDILNDAVVFVVQNGNMETVQTRYIPVHQDGPYTDHDVWPVMWAENKGLLARITVPIRSGKQYATTLEWAVTPIGERPEED